MLIHKISLPTNLDLRLFSLLVVEESMDLLPRPIFSLLANIGDEGSESLLRGPYGRESYISPVSILLNRALGDKLVGSHPTVVALQSQEHVVYSHKQTVWDWHSLRY